MEYKILIYGASTSAWNMYLMLKEKGLSPVCFVVSDTAGNPESIDGIPVKSIQSLPPSVKNAHVYVAVTPDAYQAIALSLKERGITDFEYAGLDSNVDMALRKWYFKKIRSVSDTPYIDINDIPPNQKPLQKGTAKIFMVRSHYDKCIDNAYLNSNTQYLIPIQAGAATTNQIITSCRDNLGVDHISERNRNYCELSATYWIWKNIDAPYLGLCHYRRHFHISADQIAAFQEGNYDVLLPHWGLYAPDVKTAHFKMANGRPYFDQDWDLMMEALKTIAPAYYQTAKKVVDGFYFLHYNMLLAKRQIFQSYCKFLFSVLFHIEKYYTNAGIVRADRYLGYLGEILTTIFFAKHTELRTAYCNLDQYVFDI